MNNIESSKSQQKENLFPLHQKLRSKISLRCKKCRDQIMKPDSDPISTKFYKSNNATTVLPFIQISPLLNNLYNNKFIPNSKVQLLMSFINYSPQEMEISISSLDKLSLTKNFTETTSLSDNFIKINLPCSSFKLKQQPKNPLKLENLITTIPTVELNNYSRLSRTELINRNKVIKRLSTPSTGNSQTVPLDSGINWCTIPLELSIGDLSQNLNQYKTQLKIPFFISIKQKQTENIEQAFGIWIIAKLGYIEA
ncbi:hypothetical protein PACTADRAFT_990 [Pachysolen tannophilus NRRL Y-2460]|uniref:Dynactin subunit 4 n=1 Tax=Pachysolen tannophilus NRRL Y-2460 TaxID=669874 RepID=A0A1E4U3N2_PACTA|nr:hypothetical protein PACTADRAFT_990 [Pachysolen tannophilus NRRL Y-2460]